MSDLIPSTETLAAQPTTFKPGWKTSEFWTHALVIAGLVLASSAGSLPPQWAAVAAALSQAAYNISRGLAKQAQ